jgi:hypothetical protein
LRERKHKALIGTIYLKNFSPDSATRYKIYTPKKKRKANRVLFYRFKDKYYVNSQVYSGVGGHYVAMDSLLKRYAYLTDVNPDVEQQKLTGGAILGGIVGSAIAERSVDKLSPTAYVLILNQKLYYILSPQIMKAICKGHEDLYKKWKLDRSRDNTVKILGILDKQ